MLILHAWLISLLDLRGPAPAPNELAKLLTDLGLEVEGVHAHGAGLESILVGEIPHPQASKLTVVDLFDGEQTLSVVCGAGNLPPVGGKVAFAPIGTRLPGGLEIAPRELRGVASQGMICSETELEIGVDGDGILILPDEFAAGAPLHTLVPGMVDTVLELGVSGAIGHLRDLDLGLTQWTQLVLAHGRAVEGRHAVVDGVLEHGCAPDPLVDDARRDLALAEAGDRDLPREMRVGVVDARLELLVRHLDGHFDLGGVHGFDGALHFDGLPVLGCDRPELLAGGRVPRVERRGMDTSPSWPAAARAGMEDRARNPTMVRHRRNESGWRDSNPRPSAPKADALPTCATSRDGSESSAWEERGVRAS